DAGRPLQGQEAPAPAGRVPLHRRPDAREGPPARATRGLGDPLRRQRGQPPDRQLPALTVRFHPAGGAGTTTGETTMTDLSFQGRIELGTRLAGGKPGPLTWVGDQSSCELTFDTQTEDRTETYSGQRLQSAQLRTGTTVGINLVLRHGTAHNLKLGLYATQN